MLLVVLERRLCLSPAKFSVEHICHLACLECYGCFLIFNLVLMSLEVHMESSRFLVSDYLN